MQDRTAALLLGLIATLAFLLFVAWDSDIVLKTKCRHAGGHWNAQSRVCEISAGPAPGSRVSPHR